MDKKEDIIFNENILNNKQINISNNITNINEEEILFNNSKYKKFTRKKYIKKDKIKRLIYKCENLRKNERNCHKYKHSAFCNSKIEYIYPGQGVKSGYFIKKNHSSECDNLYKNTFNDNYIDNNNDILKNNINNINDKNSFIEKCENIMNNSSIFDRRLFKNEFKNIYNKNKYSFEISDNFLSNIISKWRSKTDRFNKTTVLNNIYDYNNNQILREYRTLYLQLDNKTKPKKLEYIIWINNENLNRIRKSKYIFIDFTFHHPPDFVELLIIMYTDIITNLKIPAFYILINGKHELFYMKVFESIINILSNNNKINFNFEIIVTDAEQALINVINKIFPNSRRINCYFHYTSDILSNLKSYGLYKKKNKKDSNIILKKLSLLPFLYKGNINDILNYLGEIIKNYPQYTNFINNYFKKRKIKFFKDNSLFYNDIPSFCRTNNFLENYNGYIKNKLGRHRVINWVNFIDFSKKI